MEFFADHCNHFKGELLKYLAKVKKIEGTKTMKRSYTTIEKLKFIIFFVASLLIGIFVFKYDHFKNIVLTCSLTMILINKIRDAKKKQETGLFIYWIMAIVNLHSALNHRDGFYSSSRLISKKEETYFACRYGNFDH